MKVNKFELWNALLYSTEVTPEVKELMLWLEDNMKKAGGVVVELDTEA